VLLNVSSCPPGHNTPLPLRRSAPGSFNRLLGRQRRAGIAASSPMLLRSDVSQSYVDARQLDGLKVGPDDVAGLSRTVADLEMCRGQPLHCDVNEDHLLVKRQ